MVEETFAARLEAAMEQGGLKQVDLVRGAQARGRKLGKSQVSQYLSGKTVPRPSIMALLAELLGVDAEWLAGGSPPGVEGGEGKRPVETITEAPSARQTSTSTETKGIKMRKFTKSHKLENVLYDVRGPVVEEANRMEESGTHVLKLNIGNPAPFGFRTPDEVIYDMRRQLTDSEGYSASRGLFSARKAIMQYDQIKGIPNVEMNDIYTGNGARQ